MRILLVQVPTSHLGAGERVYPLGLSRLSSLIPDKIDKWALDMNLSADPWADLNVKLQEVQPDVVALSFRNLDPLAGQRTSYVSSLKTAARMARTLVPQATIWAGGPAFSLFAERLMHEIPEIDGGLIGEGETALPHLLAHFSNSSAVPGWVWRHGNSIQRNPLGKHTAMDTLPALDTDTFCPQDYIHRNAYVAAMGIEGKRGCDLHCGYCLYPFLGGNKMRLRPPRTIVDEIEHLHTTYGVQLFHFTDAVLNRPPEHFRQICATLLRRKLHVSWTGFFREDCLSPEILDSAIEAGLVAIYFSADALTHHGLRLLNKEITQEHILQAARLTASRKILSLCHFLINLPGETMEHATEAQDMLHRILDIHAPAGNLGAVIFNTVRLYPGAPLTRKLLKQGILQPDIDLLYPVYYNPVESSHRLHELEMLCHTAGVFSRLGLSPNK